MAACKILLTITVRNRHSVIQAPSQPLFVSAPARNFPPLLNPAECANRLTKSEIGDSMATVTAPVRRSVNPDRIFFPSMCLLILVTVWLGFSKTYYAVGMVRTHLPAPIIHVHAVVFTLWLLTLIVQIGLIRAKKVQIHRKLGLWGFGLAAAMVIIGLMAGTNALRRDMSPPGSGLDPKVFYIVPVSGILTFGTLVCWAYMARRRPIEHKRLIMFASLALLDAAIGRFPYTIMPMGPVTQNLILIALMLPMLAYDLITLKKLHRVTIISFLWIVALLFTRIPLGMTSQWLSFATFMHR
jgi:hypothetical protein